MPSRALSSHSNIVAKIRGKDAETGKSRRSEEEEKRSAELGGFGCGESAAQIGHLSPTRVNAVSSSSSSSAATTTTIIIHCNKHAANTRAKSTRTQARLPLPRPQGPQRSAHTAPAPRSTLEHRLVVRPLPKSLCLRSPLPPGEAPTAVITVVSERCKCKWTVGQRRHERQGGGRGRASAAGEVLAHTGARLLGCRDGGGHDRRSKLKPSGSHHRYTLAIHTQSPLIPQRARFTSIACSLRLFSLRLNRSNSDPFLPLSFSPARPFHVHRPVGLIISFTASHTSHAPAPILPSCPRPMRCLRHSSRRTYRIDSWRASVCMVVHSQWCSLCSTAARCAQWVPAKNVNVGRSRASSPSSRHVSLSLLRSLALSSSSLDSLDSLSDSSSESDASPRFLSGASVSWLYRMPENVTLNCARCDLRWQIPHPFFARVPY